MSGGERERCDSGSGNVSGRQVLAGARAVREGGKEAESKGGVGGKQ
jgi:hypothetical protein